MAKEINRIAYVTTLDSAAISSWSGTMLWVYDMLQIAFPEVVRIGPLKSHREPIGVIKRVASWSQRQDHPLWLTEASARGMARQVEAQLEAIRADAVFCIWHPPVAYLKTDLPIFMLQDSPFELIQPLYPEMGHLTRSIVAEASAVERAAALNCTGIIQTSEWAAIEARRLWDLPADKVAAVPLGANLTTELEALNVEQVCQSRGTDPFNLLWIGKDWHRKGGNVAVEAVSILRRRNIPAQLSIVGSPVPAEFQRPFVEELGFVDRSTATGAAAFDHIMRSSHALILPTAAEAFGIVFVEAAAYAMPSIAPNIMGVGSAIIDGVSGALVGPLADPVQYADKIQFWYENYSFYDALCRSAHGAYRERFTKEAIGREVRNFILSRV